MAEAGARKQVDRFATEATRLGCEVMRRGTVGFRRATALFNGGAPILAALALAPRDAGEVGDCLRLATDAGLTVSVRAGGHGVAGRAVRGDVVLDLRHFRRIAVDGDTVRVG